MKKKMVAMVLTMCMAAGLVACGGSKTEAPSETTEAEAPAATETPTETEAPKEEAPAAATDLKMVSYFPAPHPYYDEVQKGVEKFVADTGIPVDIQIGADWAQATQNSKVEALVAQGVNALSIYPSDASGANGLYKEIVDVMDVKVVGFGADVEQPTSQSFAVATDVKQAAYDMTVQLIKNMGEKGNIINVLEVLEDSNTAKRKEGIEEAVAQYPDVKIIQEVAGISTQEQAVEKIESALSANVGKVDGIITTGFNPSVAMVSVLKDFYEKNPDHKKIKNFVVDCDPVVIQGIKDGIIDATVAQNTSGHGYISCMLLKYLHEGYKPVAENYFVNAGITFVTKDNLEAYNEELDKVTQGILDELTTKYLTK